MEEQKEWRGLSAPPNANKDCPEPTKAQNNGQTENNATTDPLPQAVRWRTGPITKITNYGKAPHTRLLNSAILDKAIGSDALRVLAYALGRPPGWRLRFADVKKRFGWNRRTFQSAMRELEQVGYAALSEYHPSFGQCWHVREHPAIPWPKGVRFSAAAPAARLLCCTETAQHNKDLNYSKRGGVENRSSLKKESSNEQANASCERTASQLITSPLADYSEENREKIAIWHKKVCDKRPHWLRINKYTERTEQALDKWDVDDFREFCRKVARIRLRNKRDHGEGEAIGILIPKRKTLVNLLWTND